MLPKLIVVLTRRNTHNFANQRHVELYHKYRPIYPKELVTRIVRYLERGRVTSCGLAVDVGCGSGQFTRSLGKYFDRVIGVDISESQLKSARTIPNPNIEYLNGSGEAIPVPDVSTDLITCAASVHWFDFPKFCAEVQRILRPNGCVAVFSYEMQCCQINGKRNVAIENAYNELITEKTKPYFSPTRKEVFNRYAGIRFPYEDSERDDSFVINHDVMLSDFIGCIRSLSFYQCYINNNPDEPDPAQLFQQTALEILGIDTPADMTPVTMYFPVFMVLARKPATT